MHPKAKLVMEISVNNNKELAEHTYQLTLHHNEPKQDTTIVKRNLTLAESIVEIKKNMGAFRSIQLVSEQTGELMYERYASGDFYPLCECLDNDQL